MNWDRYFANIAREVETKSKDRSTKVGCVFVDESHIILATGFNGFPRGIDDNFEAYHQRPLKYSVTEHAERNAIYAAARTGRSLDYSTLYVAWHPCSGCARGIIQVGCREVVLDREYQMAEDLVERWKEDLDIAEMLFTEAGVVVRHGEP